MENPSCNEVWIREVPWAIKSKQPAISQSQWELLETLSRSLAYSDLGFKKLNDWHIDYPSF